MNIKYRFSNDEKVSNPKTSVNLFREDGTEHGGLYARNGESPANFFERNLSLINQRINGIKKQLSYWDLYKITKQVTDASELDSVFTSLTPGQSCVINCLSFIEGDITYHKGDIVIKMLDGEAAYIPAVASGLYYPSKIYQNATNGSSNYYYYYWKDNNITIKNNPESSESWHPDGWYICSQKDPMDALQLESNNIYIIKDDEVLTSTTTGYDINPNINLDYQYALEAPTNTIDFKIPNIDAQNSITYGIYELITETSIIVPVLQYTSNNSTYNIKPVIKFFTEEHEEIWCDFTVEKDEVEGVLSWIIDNINLPTGNNYIQIR